MKTPPHEVLGSLLDIADDDDEGLIAWFVANADLDERIAQGAQALEGQYQKGDGEAGVAAFNRLMRGYKQLVDARSLAEVKMRQRNELSIARVRLRVAQRVLDALGERDEPSGEPGGAVAPGRKGDDPA